MSHGNFVVMRICTFFSRSSSLSSWLRVLGYRMDVDLVVRRHGCLTPVSHRHHLRCHILFLSPLYSGCSLRLPYASLHDSENKLDDVGLFFRTVSSSGSVSSANLAPPYFTLNFNFILKNWWANILNHPSPGSMFDLNEFFATHCLWQVNWSIIRRQIYNLFIQGTLLMRCDIDHRVSIDPPDPKKKVPENCFMQIKPT